MSLPPGLPTVTVTTGPHTDFAGVPYIGTVTLTPSTPVVWSATGAVILDGDVTASLDAAGAATIVLPATDATGLTVRNFTYTVRWALKSASGEAASILPVIIQLPQAAPTVDLDLMETITSSTGVQVGLPAVLSVAGLTGVVSASGLKTALGIGSPVVLADAATIATDASLGPLFRVTLGGNRTLGVPTNSTDGQRATWEITQDGTGSRGLTLATGTGGFKLGTAPASIIPSSSPGATDYLTAIYRASASRWNVLSYATGY